MRKRAEGKNISNKKRAPEKGRSLYVVVLLCRFGNTEILGLVKCQNAVEDDAQEDEADRKPAAFAKGFCELHYCDDGKYDACKRNQQEQELPAVAPGDLKEHIEIVERDDRRPT